MTTTAPDWKATLGDDAVWAMLKERPDLAGSALEWLTNTIADVDQQLSQSKANTAIRLPSDELADERDWRARAIWFKRIMERRRRALVPVVKAHHQADRDHDADGQWKWQNLTPHDITPEEAFMRGFVAGRTT